MKWYIVVRDTDSGREYLVDTGYDATYAECYIWGNYVPTLFVHDAARYLAKEYGGYVVTLKEVTP